MATLKVPVTTEDHSQGNEKALITLVEYGDYECPFCGRAYPIVKELQRYFGDRLRFVFRNFPLTNIHHFAEVAAETAEFAANHYRFWEMHDLIYENQESLSLPLLSELAQTLKLSVSDLELALENRTYEPKVKKDFLGGARSGVNGTPAFYINGTRYNGPVEFEDMVAALTLKTTVGG